MRLYRLNQAHRSALILLISVFIFVVLCFTWWKSAITNRLNDWKLLPQPERLTELYVTNPKTLPATYTPGQTSAVNFTLHNLEGRTITYNYVIVEENSSQSQTIVKGSLVLTQGQIKSVTYKAQLTDMGSDVRIVIEIPTVHESINYQLERSDQ